MYANRKNLAALFGVTTQTVYRRVKGIEALMARTYSHKPDSGCRRIHKRRLGTRSRDL